MAAALFLRRTQIIVKYNFCLSQRWTCVQQLSLKSCSYKLGRGDLIYLAQPHVKRAEKSNQFILIYGFFLYVFLPFFYFTQTFDLQFPNRPKSKCEERSIGYFYHLKLLRLKRWTRSNQTANQSKSHKFAILIFSHLRGFPFLFYMCAQRTHQ